MCVRFSRFCGIFAALAITFALCLGGVDASAEVVTKSFTPLEFQDLVGDTLDFTYYDGTNYVDSTAYFEKTATIQTLDSSGNYVSGIPCLLYYADVINPVNTNRNYDTVTIHPNFYFQNISSLSFSFYCSTGIGTQYSNVVSKDTYRSPSVDFFVDGSRVHQNYGWWNNGGWCNFVTSDNDLKFLQAAYSWASDSEAALITLGDVHFNGVSDQYDRIIFAVTVPTISEDATLTAGQYVDPNSGSGSGGQTIINNNVDLTETHSILGGISNFLSDIWESIRGVPGSILSGIQAIFVPEDGYFDSKVAQVKAKFSWYEDIVDAWTEFKTALNGISADTPPSITLSLDNRTFFGRPIGSGSGTALVLDWMYTYRNTIRNLLSAFMWIFFIWRLYCHIPNIISGSGMEVQKTDEGAAWTIHGHKL